MHYQAYNNTTTRQYDKVINFVLCYKYDAAATEDLPVAEQPAVLTADRPNPLAIKKKIANCTNHDEYILHVNARFKQGNDKSFSQQ